MVLQVTMKLRNFWNVNLNLRILENGQDPQRDPLHNNSRVRPLLPTYDSHHPHWCSPWCSWLGCIQYYLIKTWLNLCENSLSARNMKDLRKPPCNKRIKLEKIIPSPALDIHLKFQGKKFHMTHSLFVTLCFPSQSFNHGLYTFRDLIILCFAFREQISFISPFRKSLNPSTTTTVPARCFPSCPSLWWRSTV